MLNITANARLYDWDSMVSIHEDSHLAITWNMDNKSVGKHQLEIPQNQGSATAVASTVCGNFTIVGSQHGTLYKFNLQSGKKRAVYGDPKVITWRTK